MAWLRRYWPILVLLLAPLVSIGGAVFSSNGIGAFDQIQAMAPWNGPKPEQAYDVLQADSVLQFYAWRDLVFTSWASGVPPYWNPYALAGTPLLANSQSAGLYPPHILVGVLRLPTETGIDLLAWFHLFMAGWGVYAIIRRFGGNEVGGVAGALTFQLSPFMLAWTALPSVISTLAWVPWLMSGIAFALGFSLDSDKARSAAGMLVRIAIPVALTFLAGHLQFAFYGMFGSLLCGIVLLIVAAKTDRRTALSGVAFAVVGVVLGVMLAAPQLGPVLDYGQYSHRKTDPSEENYKAYLGLAIPPAEAFTRLVGPFAQGDPRIQNEALPTEFLPAILKPGANFAESATTVGPLAIIGALLAWRRKDRRLIVGGLWALALLIFLFTIGHDVNRLFYFGVPGWASTGSPGRIQALMILALSVVAGLGLSFEPEERLEKASLGLLGLGLVCCIASSYGSGFAGEMDPALAPFWSGVRASSMIGVAIATLLSAAMILFAVKKPDFGHALAATPLALGIIFGSFGLVRSGDPSFLKPPLAAIPEYSRVVAINERWSFVGITPAIFPPNTLTALRSHELGGYDSLLHRDTTTLTNDVNGQDSFPPANGNMVFMKTTVDRQKLAEAGVSMILTRDAAGAINNEEIDGPGRASTPNGPAEIVSESLDSISVKATGPGKLTLRDRNMPGWRASIDGKPVEIGGSVWREVEIPEGSHVVQFTYEPPKLKQGLLACAISLLALLAVWGFDRTRSRKG